MIPLPITPKKILVRMPNWLGDLVMATPILTDLNLHWPEAKITALCQGTLGTVIQEDPHIHEILNFKRPKNIFDFETQKNIISSLKQGNYDLGILLTNSFSSAFRFWQAAIPHRIGYAAHWRSPFLNYPLPFPKEKATQHLVKTYKMLLNPLGIPTSSTSPRLYLSSQEKEKARQLLVSHGIQPSDIVIGINPGAAYGSAKCWIPERFMKLSKELLLLPRVKIVFFGDKVGTPLVDEICRQLPSQVINLAGKTLLRELIALIEACNLFLTNDSGPMHVASAVGTPLVAIFGPTNDISTGPYQGGTVIHKHVSCSPCYRRECPLADFRCMKEITVEEVYKKIQKLLM